MKPFYVLQVFEPLKFQIGRKPLGRFHSFDVKRSLFSCKRLADEQTTVNSPATKRLRDAEEQFKTLELQVSEEKKDNKNC